MKKVSKKKLKEFKEEAIKILAKVASDWDSYCDFYGGRNLDSEEEFNEEPFDERLERMSTEYLDDVIQEKVDEYLELQKYY